MDGRQELAQVFKSLHTRVELGESITTSQSQVICCCLWMTIRLIFQDIIQPVKTETKFCYTLIRVNPCFRAILIKRLRFQVLSMSEATNLHLAPTICNLARPTQPSYSPPTRIVWSRVVCLFDLVWVIKTLWNMCLLEKKALGKRITPTLVQALDNWRTFVRLG